MSSVHAQPALTYTQIAHELGCHPSAPARWVLRGVLLKDGSRLKLEAIALPGSWRVERQALDKFLEILTEDRMQAHGEASTTSTKPVRSGQTERVRSELRAAGLLRPST
jgi:hypothetical protein